MFDTLGERLNKALDGVRGSGNLTEDQVKKVTREIRLALVETANGRHARRPQRTRQDDDGREASFVRSEARQESLSRRLRHVQAGGDRPAAADRAGALGACVYRGHGA